MNSRNQSKPLQAGDSIAAARLPSENKSRFSRRALRAVLSYGIAAACLYWVFHDLNFHEFFRSFAGVNWWFVPPAIVLDVLFYVVVGWEWQILLQPVARLSLRQTTQAVFAGRFANDVLPVHVGYLARLYLASRWSGAKVVSVAPSLLVERLFDGFWLALGLGLTAMFVPLPPAITHTAQIWTGIVVFGLVIGCLVVFRKPRCGDRRDRDQPQRTWLQKARATGAHLLDQVRSIVRSPLALAAFGISFLKLVVQALAFLFVLWAYGFQLPLGIQLAVFVVACVGISLPSTPAGAGVFQLFCVAALQMVHVPKASATSFAMLAFVILTVPLSVGGFIAMAQSGLTLRQMRREAGRWKSSAGRQSAD